MTKNKILIIEDDRFLIKIYQTKLKKAGFEIELALNGEEGLEKVKTFKPNLILLDLILPKMNGFEVLEKIKTDEAIKNIPVIILSNLGQKSDVKQGMELGAVDHLVKSDHSIDEVVKKVRMKIQEEQP